MKRTTKPKVIGTVATVLLAMLIVASVSALVDNDKNADRKGLVETIAISGTLTPPEDTDDFPFDVPSGQGWDTVSADVLVSNIHPLDRFRDISIELVDPDGTVVAGDSIDIPLETHLNFYYSPGHDLKAGRWHIYVKGEDLNGEPGYDGSAQIYN